MERKPIDAHRAFEVRMDVELLYGAARLIQFSTPELIQLYTDAKWRIVGYIADAVPVPE